VQLNQEADRTLTHSPIDTYLYTKSIFTSFIVSKISAFRGLK